jgi:uncharacterized membrane protein YsdA (DUF1294 family)
VKRRRVAWTALALLSLGEILSVYFLLFAAWMTAYPYADLSGWRIRFYQRLVITILVGVSWGVVAIWLFRHRKKTQGRTLNGG